jgi:hypothetical protein
MDCRLTIAGLLVSVSAHAKKHGLVELEKRVSDAAMAALLELPGAGEIEELIALASADRTPLRH